MAKYRITGPDGATYEVTAPDGATEQDVLAYVQQNVSAGTRPSPRQAEDESMARYEEYKKSPDAYLQSLPRPVRNVLRTLRDSVTGIGQGATFNMGDEIQAALATPIEMLRGAPSVSEAYSTALDKARRTVKTAETRSPVAATIGNIAGGTTLGGTLQRGGLTFLNAAKPSVLSMAGRGAAEGAAYGSAYGFGQGEGREDRLNQALKQGGLGALTGGIAGGIAGRAAQRAANKAIPTTEQLRAASAQAYKQADQAGLVVSPKAFGDMVDDIAAKMTTEGIDRTIHPKAVAALKRLTEAKGAQPTLGEIDTLRRVVRSAAASNDPSERRLANIMIDRIDDFVLNLKPSDVVAGDAMKATSALNKARDFWSRMRKSEMIGNAVERAKNTAASSGSGGNIDNAIRQRIRAILDNPKQARGFTAEERELMTRVVRGAPVQNLARLVGKLSPEGNGLMLMLHGVGGYASGGASLPLAVVGYGAKRFADSATARNVDALSRLIRSGGTFPQPQMLPAQQRALLEAIIANSHLLSGLTQEQVPVR